MKPRVSINGFGRIGRMVFRKVVLNDELDMIAINARYPIETICHLIKYDTIHGIFNGDISYEGNTIIVNGKRIQLVNHRDPKELPWNLLNIDIVIEATGKFVSKETASWHLDAGAKKVIITAPGKQEDITIVMGVNEHDYDEINHHIISNASCTTNCLAPIVKVLEDEFGVESGFMTTVHSYTNNQNIMDNPHKDLRRARACGQSIIPTTTGAAKAISKVLPELTGKLNGLALRVPTPNVSLIDLVVDVKSKVSIKEINEVFQRAAHSYLKGILDYTESPLVSSDYIGNPNSTIIDGLSTMVIGDKKVKIIAWYDNEWGYSSRVVDLTTYVGRHLKADIKKHKSA